MKNIVTLLLAVYPVPVPEQLPQIAICHVQPGNHENAALVSPTYVQPGAATKQPTRNVNPAGLTNVCSCAPLISLR